MGGAEFEGDSRHFLAHASKVVGTSAETDAAHSGVAEIQAQLEQAGKHLLVIIDDIDRFSASEILLILQFLGLNQHFRRINYLLLMDDQTDRQRLEKAASDPEILEGTLHFNFTLPYGGEARLKQVLFDGLHLVLENLAGAEDWSRIEATWDAR